MNHIRTIYILAAALSALLVISSSALADPSAQAMIAADNAQSRRPDVKEAQRLYNAGATFVDVRSDQEWREGHVKGALHMPVKELPSDASEKLTDKNQPIVTYCELGGRAAKGAAILRQLGYHNVTAMSGGFPDWQKIKLPSAR